MDIFIITGSLHGGKTSFAARLAEALKKAGRSVGGFVSPGLWNGGVRSGFDIRDVFSGETVPLARTEAVSGYRFRQFSFFPEGIEFGFSSVKASLGRPDDYVFIDEVGKMETQGMGWGPLIPDVLSSRSAAVFAVRAEYAGLVAETFSIKRPVIIDIEAPLEAALAFMGLGPLYCN